MSDFDKTHRPFENFDSYLMNEKLRAKLPDTYVMLRIASKRAHQIERGSHSRLSKELTEGHKPTTIAMMEIEHGIIDESYLIEGDAIEQSWEEEKNPKPKKEDGNEQTETTDIQQPILDQ